MEDICDEAVSYKRTEVQKAVDAVFVSHEKVFVEIDLEGGALCLRLHLSIWLRRR